MLIFGKPKLDIEIARVMRRHKIPAKTPDTGDDNIFLTAVLELYKYYLTDSYPPYYEGILKKVIKQKRVIDF